MATRNRKAAEQYLIDFVEKLCPGGENKKLYQDAFAKMSDAEFDKLMQDFESGAARPPVQSPNFGTARLDLERNIKIMESLGKSFWERLWITTTDEDGNTSQYLSPVEYMIVELPLRRQAQLLDKKLSVPEHNRSVDQLTGQPAGDSRSAGISYPELQIMRGMGLDESLLELIKWRGGDVKGFDAMNKTISRDGAVSLKSIAHLAGGVESTASVKVFLTCMHLRNTL